MNCPLCREEMVKSKTNLPYEMGEDRLLVIKDVPAILCRQCGDYFIEIQVARVVERIIEAADKDGVMLGFLKYQEAA
jgi:YgiT-type zinc finger domain-containing protein